MKNVKSAESINVKKHYVTIEQLADASNTNAWEKTITQLILDISRYSNKDTVYYIDVQDKCGNMREDVFDEVWYGICMKLSKDENEALDDKSKLVKRISFSPLTNAGQEIIKNLIKSYEKNLSASGKLCLNFLKDLLTKEFVDLNEYLKKAITPDRQSLVKIAFQEILDQLRKVPFKNLSFDNVPQRRLEL